MTPLLVILPYHKGDVDLAKSLLEHVASFSERPDSRHSILLVADSGVDPAKTTELMDIARKVFNSGKDIRLTITATGWPKAANQMFVFASKHVEEAYRLPFLWLEPDCVPLSGDWLDRIADAYERCPQRFMGPLVFNTDQPGLPPVHLSGCSVYPNDAYSIMEAQCRGEQAFDIASADTVVKSGRARDSKLIAHMWGLRDLPPTFVSERTADSPKNALTIDQIPNGAVLWHRCKDGTLFNVLRKSWASRKPLPMQQDGKTVLVMDRNRRISEVPDLGSAIVQSTPKAHQDARGNEVETGAHFQEAPRKQSVSERMAAMRAKRKPKVAA